MTNKLTFRVEKHRRCTNFLFKCHNIQIRGQKGIKGTIDFKSPLKKVASSLALGDKGDKGDNSGGGKSAKIIMKTPTKKIFSYMQCLVYKKSSIYSPLSPFQKILGSKVASLLTFWNIQFRGVSFAKLPFVPSKLPFVPSFLQVKKKELNKFRLKTIKKDLPVIVIAYFYFISPSKALDDMVMKWKIFPSSANSLLLV